LLNKTQHFEQLFGLTDTLIYSFLFYCDNKKQAALRIVSLTVMLSCLCSFQVHAQTGFVSTSETPKTEQEYRAKLDRWMLTAFEGDPQAQYKVGVLNTNSQFHQPDFEQAVYWYRQAARQGHIQAQYNLGHQYLLGIGVNKNEGSAMKWWLEAAKQDHSLAQFNIGRAYYLGIGLEQDHKKSKHWFSRAADNEEPKSIEILAKLGWADGDIDTSVAPDFEGKPSSNAAVMKALGLGGKTDGQRLAQDARDTNSASQLAIKEPRGRRATPNLKSKITPFDLSEKTSAAPKPNAGHLSRETGTQDDPQRSSQKSFVRSNSPEPRNSLELNNSKPSIAQNRGRPSNQQHPTRKPLKEAIADNPGKDLAKIQQVKKPILIDSQKPVAIYTDPRIRSVLIAIINDQTDLTITKAGSQWSSVKSNTGLPVWVRGDYLKLDRPLANNDSVLGRITGDNVNTRSVPIVSSGTLVGRLNKGERLRVIEKRGKWYRVIGPTRFTAWVKTRDFNAPATRHRPTFKQAASKPDSRYSDNEWLFQQKPNDYTLQLGSFVGDTQTGNFLSSIDFSQSSNLHQLGSKIDNIQRTVFVYGAYKNRKLATDTKLKINQKQAWVRAVGGLQKNRCKQWQEQRPAPEEHQRYCKQ
jgi:uncharacterized protein YgiM (DUF1202 family)